MRRSISSAAPTTWYGAALQSLSIELAQAQIVRDGEGATKFMTITEGGRSREECKTIGYAIARSPLVKTALFASDLNLAAMDSGAAIGYADDDLDVDQLSLYLDDVLVAVNMGVTRPIRRRRPAGDEQAGNPGACGAGAGVKPLPRCGHATFPMTMRINADYSPGAICCAVGYFP